MPMPLSEIVNVRAVLSAAVRIFKVLALDIGIVSKSFEIKLIKCIACIRNQLAKKNLLVCVNRVDHQIKQLGFRFKLFLG